MGKTETTPTGVPPEFATVFRELVMGIQPARALERDTCHVYYETLQQFPLDVLRQAALKLRERANGFFPSAGEWFQAATALQWEARRALGALPDTNVIMCDRCQDTGSVYAECSGDSTCGRQRAHPAHGFVCVCACRQTNLRYQRNRAAEPRRGSDDES